MHMELPGAAAASASLLLVSKGCIGPAAKKAPHVLPRLDAGRADTLAAECSTCSANSEPLREESRTEAHPVQEGQRAGGANTAVWEETYTSKEPGLRCRRHAEKIPSAQDTPEKKGYIVVKRTGALLGRRYLTENAKTQGPRSELRTRLIYGLLLGVCFAWILVRGSGWFTGGVVMIATLSAKEYFGLLAAMAAKQKWTPVPPRTARLCWAICTMMPIVAMFWGDSVHVALLPAAGALMLALHIESAVANLRHVLCLFWGLLYCGYFPSFWVKIRLGLPSHLPPGVIEDCSGWSPGLVTCFITICSIIAADAGAYFVGKRFGKTRMTVLSPKKTWEGAAFGVASAVCATFLLTKWFHWPASNASALVFGLVVFGASVFGDLFESALKRSAGVKDSGALIPGHGGVLDRFDSYIFTGAIVYCLVDLQVM